MLQTEITIRLVLPAGVEASGLEEGRLLRLCELVDGLVSDMFPGVAEEIEVDVEIGFPDPGGLAGDDLVVPIVT